MPRPRVRSSRPSRASSLEGAPDGDQAAAVARGELALGRQPVAGAPLAGVERGAAGRDRPGDGAGRDRARAEAGHRAGATSGEELGDSGVLRMRLIADNVISNRCQVPRESGRDGMGVKIAVVGGGSTYTPELVEGFARRARPPADRRAGPARHRPRAARDRRRPGPADARPARLARPADPHRRPRRRHRRRRLRAHPAARRRPGGAARRRDAAADVRRRSARRRPAPAASPRRCGPCRSSSSSPS